MTLSISNVLSIDLDGYQSKLRVSAPLVLTGDVLSINLSPFMLATTLASTLANYAAKSSLTPYALSSSLGGYATTASLSSYAQMAALSAYAPLSTLARYALKTDVQNTLTVSSPLVLSGSNNLSLGNLGAAAATSIAVSGLTSTYALTVAYNATLQSVGVLADCTIGGALQVTNATTLVNASCSGALGVAGVATFATASIGKLSGAAFPTTAGSIQLVKEMSRERQLHTDLRGPVRRR